MDLMTMANFIKETLIPMTIEPNAKMSTIEVIGLTLIGMSVVFLGLIILIMFVWAFGKLFTRKTDDSDAEKKNEKLKSVVAPVTPAVNNNDDEIVAVIAAAVAAMGQADGKTYRVKSIRAAKNVPARSAWALAGLQSETTPF